MFNKILKFLKFVFVGTIWTYIYVLLVDILIIKYWHFNILSSQDWRTIRKFWEQGGVIKESKDYLFLSILILLVPLWLITWRMVSRINFINILLYPVYKYNQHIIKKYGSDSKRILLKNMGRSKKVKEQLEEMMKPLSQKSGKESETSKMRQVISEKLKAAQNGSDN